MRIQHRRLRIASHTHRAQLVNNLAAFRDFARRLLCRPLRLRMPPRPGNHRPARPFHNRPERRLHIRGHLDLVLSPTPVEAQHRNAPLVLHVRVKFAEALVVRNHLAASTESDERAIRATALLFQAYTVAFLLFAHAIKAAYPRHVASAPKFNVVAAQKFILLAEAPPRHVHVHAAYAVMVVRRHLFKLRKVSCQVAAD